MKAWKVIRSIFVWLMVVFAVGMMVFTVISVSTFDRADRKLFGYRAFIVLSDSMSKTDFNAGDLVLVMVTPPQRLLLTLRRAATLSRVTRWATRRFP